MRPFGSLPVLLVLASIGCGGGTTATPPVATGTVPAQPPPPATVEASATPATSAAPPAELKRVPIDAPATLARLPDRAAVYGWLRPASADTLVGWTSRPDEARRELAEVLPGGSARGLLGALGIEAGAPIAFAITGPERAPIEKVVKALASGKSTNALAREVDSLPPNGVHIRLVAHAAPGADVVGMFEERAKEARIDAVHCPGNDRCAVVSPGTDLILVWHELIGTLDVEGSRVELDLVRGRGPAKKLVATLAESRKAPGGGPKGRCSKLDAEADLSICVDADRAAELGAASGMWMTFSALEGAGVDAKATREIAKVGLAESLRNIELSAPKRRLLDDGTLALRLSAEGFTAAGSWELTKNSKAGLESKLGEQRCAPPATILTDLFSPLIAGLGDRGADFRDVNPRIEHVREAGFGAALVLFARTWPNFLGIVASPHFTLGRAPLTRACAKTNGGRLDIELTGSKIAIDQLPL